MLRALAGYFFGGIKEETAETTLECETQEVNDWLVVNMADHPRDNINLDDTIDSDMVQIDDDEDDDILNAVSFLMRADELERSDGSFSDENSEDDMDSLTWSRSDESLSERSGRLSVCSNNDFFPEENSLLLRDPLSLINMGYYVTPKDVLRSEIVQSFQSDDLAYFIAQPDFPSSTLRLQMRAGNPKSSLRYQPGVQELLNYENDVKVIRQSDVLAIHEDIRFPLVPFRRGITDVQKYPTPKVKELIQKVKERNVMKNRIADVTCHPINSKTYVNHRHPALPPKTDLMQKIKELEPEQQAKEYIIKKRITRGQLNRQNKNYIYDSSHKKNRRKNLQRNPSGANNNRKC